MATVKRLVGAALFGYAVLYTLQVVFSSLYAAILPPPEVWRVMNFCTAVGIIVSVTVVCAHKRSAVKPDSPPDNIWLGWRHSIPRWPWPSGSSPSGSDCCC